MTETTEKKSSKWPFILAIIVFAAVPLIFFQNRVDTQLVLFFRTINVSVNFLVFATFFCGFIFGLLIMLPGRISAFRSNKALKKQLQALEKDKNQFINEK